MAAYRTARELDWPLFLLAFTIIGLGVLQIYSATQGTTWEGLWWHQLIWVGIGLLLMWLTTEIDYHTLLDQVPVFYLLAVIGLVATTLVGVRVFGARRWIAFPGGFLLQVSEFNKIVIVLLVARFLTDLRSNRLEFRDFLKLAALVGLPTLLVLRQPDLGTALTYLPVLAAGVFFGGLRWQYIAAMALGVALLVPVVWRFGLKDYQRSRIETFLDPGSDPRGAGYQVIQSKIAIGSGGMWGKGVTQGSQTQLSFLPVPHTDFIFASFGEEHGFVGVVVALGLYFLLLMQIVQNAQMASDRAGMYICLGICAILLFHVLVNVGMVVGRMPVTGVPLPLMSYGGSNMLSVFLMLGLVNNVRLRRFVN